MAFCLVFGTQDFQSELKGYEGVTVQCQKCNNFSARPISRWPFFTVCWIPLIPLATHRYHELSCHICHFLQDLKYRPDVTQGRIQGQQGGPPPGYGGSGQGQPQYR